MPDANKWEPIETAPKDCRPVWARGWDHGMCNTTRHYAWVYFDGGEWRFAGHERSFAKHLTDWMKSQDDGVRELAMHEVGG